MQKSQIIYVKDNVFKQHKQGLQHFMKIAVSLYSVSGQNKKTSLIDAKYHHLSGVIKEKLRAAVNITLITDNRNCEYRRLFGFTTHFSNDDKIISKQLELLN